MAIQEKNTQQHKSKDTLKSFFQTKEATGVHTIEIVGTTVKYAFIEEHAGAVSVQTQVEINAESGSETALLQVLKELLPAQKKDQAPVILVVPRQLSTVRYLEVPSTEEKEIENIVAFQAVKQVPFSLEEIVIGFQLLEILPTGYGKVMLVIFHQDVIKKQLHLLAQANLYPDCIQLNTQAIASAAQTQFPDSEQPMAFLDFDNTTINFLVVDKRGCLYSRSFPRATDNPDRVVLEVERSMSDCKQQGIIPHRIVLFGKKDEQTNTIESLLARRLTAPVFQAEVPLLWQGRTGSQLALIGAVLGMKANIDFLPAVLRKNKQEHTRLKSVISYGMCGLLVLLSAYLLFWGKTLEKQKYLDTITGRLKEIQPQASSLEEMQEKVMIMEKHIQQRPAAIDILREMYTIIPDSVSLSSFAFEADRPVIIKGVADNMEQVFDLIPKLEQSSYLENVVSKYATKRNIQGKELTEFQLQCSIEGQDA